MLMSRLAVVQPSHNEPWDYTCQRSYKAALFNKVFGRRHFWFLQKLRALPFWIEVLHDLSGQLQQCRSQDQAIFTVNYLEKLALTLWTPLLLFMLRKRL